MFYKKYKFPLNLFLILEHNPIILYTSEVLPANHYICLTTPQWYSTINLILKKDLHFNFNSLIEMSSIDTKNYNNFLPDLSVIFNNNRLLVHNTYYMYFTKTRLSLFYYYSLKNNNKITSIDIFFKNANWMERELSEMFSVVFFNKTDTRLLLLDYPKDNFPLLKDFPTESWSELYYDFLDKSLHYSDVIDHTEL